MSQNTHHSDLQETIKQRANSLFLEHQQRIYQSTDRLFAGLMLAQWVGGIIAVLLISPYTWEGGISRIHPNVWAAIFLGGGISLFPVFLAATQPGASITRYTIAIAQMLMSGLLIHLTGGRIETHFHIFGSLAFLAFYRDWRVLIPATVVTSLDHFARGIFWPESIYGVLMASPWRTVEHIWWVAFEDIFLIVSCLRSVREMRAIAWHTAQLETTNQVIEEKVVERTAEVKASEERFRLLMDGVQDYAIIMLDTKGKIVSWNEGAKRVTGYAAEDILGKHFSDLHPMQHREPARAALDLQTAATQGRLEQEGWRLRQDGSEFWANVVFTALYDENEELRGFSKVTRDVTHRKEAEESLRKTNDELEARVEQRTAELAQSNSALQLEIEEHQRDEAEIRLQNALLAAQGEATVEGILVVSAKGEITSFNQRFAELWGISSSWKKVRSTQDFLESILEKVVDPLAFNSKISSLYEKTDTKNQEEIVLKSGSIYDFYGAPLKGADGTYYGRIWFFRDVTESKRAAESLHQAKVEAERANAAKSEFLSRMSHELRTPMNAILGFGQLLEWDDLTTDQSESVGQILKGGRHLLTLINEVLEISRIEAGHMSLSLEPVSVDIVLRDAFDLVAPLATQKGIELNDTGMGSCSHIVMADQQRLKQVILNLLSNAIKYNRPSGTVAVSCEKNGPNHLRLLFTDTGLGISAENLEKLFVPFERLGAENTDIEGNGIGLSLSRQLMRLMDGEIGVSSQQDKGSTFWVELQLGEEHEIDDLHHDKLPVGPQELEIEGDKPTILYIEDNLSNLKLVEAILRRHFHIELLSAMQGSLGLQLARQHQPDLILLDLHLPDIMGDKVLMQLQSGSATQDIPVVMLSADATERQIQRLLDLGAKAYLTKPLEVNRFLEVINHNLKAPQVAK